MIRNDRRILELVGEELELFVYDWVTERAKHLGYFEVERFSGSGDLGRDVVGFCSAARHEGHWDNYQCKQYRERLGPATAHLELGKLLFYAFKGQFTTPRNYYFVAPRGINRPLQELVYKPSDLKKSLLTNWEAHCMSKIAEDKEIPLVPALEQFIQAYDFSRVHVISLDKMLVDPSIKPVLAKHFGDDPGPPPKGSVPTEVQVEETPYIRQLLDVYGQCDNCVYATHEQVASHAAHGPHLVRQRERFFEADAFQRFYRDNTAPESLDQLEDDIFHGVIDTHGSVHSTTLKRVEAVMTQAANVQPSGPLAKYARVPIKQGYCHHFANEERLKWNK
ncbi:ABC-three component system protein [Corallococcus sp. AS-1-6]|uniref:ABC-three component system protein n=1 Tax=Corallococcus sp. AS-1-6 TaxID=2874599 RepID=UPI001CC0D959|nr:ABC-three component system protein [Corallococcus sp. AS-1-6]MBZ4370223.1 hypothetical protein [Corallococcus sp. AS-1-6]